MTYAPSGPSGLSGETRRFSMLPSGSSAFVARWSGFANAAPPKPLSLKWTGKR
jgi:hypothetical protein